MQKHIFITLMIVALASVACEARRQRPGKRPSPPCRRIACNIKCSNGLVKDSKGCPECKCNPPPTTTPATCRQARCMRKCPNGYAKNSNGCQTCRCNRRTDLCTGRKDVGNKRCSDLSNAGMKYYFDKKTGKCQQFSFKGCRGNGNRYSTEHDCMCRCTKTEESCKKAGQNLIKS